VELKKWEMQPCRYCVCIVMYWEWLVVARMRSPTSREERARGRRQRGVVRRVAVASAGQGINLAGSLHQKQMRRGPHHSPLCHNSGTLSTRVRKTSPTCISISALCILLALFKNEKAAPTYYQLSPPSAPHFEPLS